MNVVEQYSIMKIFTLSLIALSTFAASAFASIGETYKESCAHYGAPHHRHNNHIVWFVNKDFSIEASFDDQNGRCDSIYYYSWREPFAENQLSYLIASNVDKSDQFREFPSDTANARFWASLRDKVSAWLSVEMRAGGQRNPFELAVFSAACLERYALAHPKNNEQVAPAIEQLPVI
jgi:hypothetical protein